jgi:hypothetical protein
MNKGLAAILIVSVCSVANAAVGAADPRSTVEFGVAPPMTKIAQSEGSEPNPNNPGGTAEVTPIDELNGIIDGIMGSLIKVRAGGGLVSLHLDDPGEVYVVTPAKFSDLKIGDEVEINGDKAVYIVPKNSASSTSVSVVEIKGQVVSLRWKDAGGGQGDWIVNVTEATRFFRKTPGKLSDVKVGDTIYAWRRPEEEKDPVWRVYEITIGKYGATPTVP